MEPFCLGLCALTKLIKKKICAKFPGQVPFGPLRRANDVTGVADLENSAALAELGSEDIQERGPFVVVILPVVYKTLWLVTWPVCQFKPPFGR